MDEVEGTLLVHSPPHPHPEVGRLGAVQRRHISSLRIRGANGATDLHEAAKDRNLGRTRAYSIAM